MSSVLIQLVVGAILVLTLVLIATERIHKTLAALIGAGLALVVAISPGSDIGVLPIVSGIEDLLVFVEPDLLFVIVGMTMMVSVAQDTGLFQYVTVLLLKRSGPDQKRLLITLCLVTMVFASLLNAFISVLIVGGITLGACRILEIDFKPYILGEAIFGNLGGMMTRIASPPNLIIGGTFNIGFVEFFMMTAPFVIASAVATIVFWFYLFKSSIGQPINMLRYDQIMLMDERSLISNDRGFKIAVVILALTTIGFAIAPFLPLHLELGYISLAGGFAMVGLVDPDIEHSLKQVDWPIIFFFAGLLTIVGITEKTGLLVIIANPIEALMDVSILGGLLFVLWTSALTSSLVDNVPVASVMTEVMHTVFEHRSSMSRMPLIISAVIGTNLGGNITPIGSASTVQAMMIIERGGLEESKLSFLDFVKIGLPITIIHLLIGTLYVVITSFIM